MSRFPLAAVLILLVLLAGCGAERSQEEAGPPGGVDEQVEEPREGETQQQPVGDPGRSGLFGAFEVDAPAARFTITEAEGPAGAERILVFDAFRALISPDGVLSLFSDRELLWQARGVTSAIAAPPGMLIAADREGLTAYSPADGQILWSRRLDTQVRDLQLSGASVAVLHGSEIIWISVEGGRTSGRQSLLGEGIELLGHLGALYAITEAGIEAIGREREFLWSEEIPGAARITIGGDPARLLLEAGSAVLAYDLQEGRLLWERPLEKLPAYRPVVAGQGVYLAYATGVVQRLSLASGSVGWSRGLAGALHARPGVWQGRLWLPVDPGSLQVHLPTGELLGRLTVAGSEARELYATTSGMGVLDRYGDYRELSPGGNDVALELHQGSGETLALPRLLPGEGPLMVRLEGDPVSVDLGEVEGGIYRFFLPLQEQNEAVIDVVNREGELMGSNLDKTENSEELRLRLEEDISYTLLLRPVREEQAGDLVAVSFRLLRR